MDGMPRLGGVAIANCSPMMGISTPLLSLTFRVEDAIVVIYGEYANRWRKFGGSGGLVYQMI